jgi:hypothetical protein
MYQLIISGPEFYSVVMDSDLQELGDLGAEFLAQGYDVSLWDCNTGKELCIEDPR